MSEYVTREEWEALSDLAAKLAEMVRLALDTAASASMRVAALSYVVQRLLFITAETSSSLEFEDLFLGDAEGFARTLAETSAPGAQEVADMLKVLRVRR